jgi:hypothetical protein
VDARGIGPEKFIEGVKAGNMELLGDWTTAANQVLIF